MTYPGNPAISAEVQKRIRNTFEQTLALAARGSRQEASLGCDFILQLDPQFRPAKTLRDRLQTGDGAVEVEDLRAALAGRPSEQEQKAEADALFGEGSGGDGGEPFDPLEDLELDSDLDDELPDLADSTGGPGAPADGATTAAAELKATWEELLAERRFDDILEQAEAARLHVEGDPELARLVTTAGERQEAASFVQRFLERARQAVREGDVGEAEELVGKARSLDPTHPGIAEVEALLASGSAPPPTPPPTPPPKPPAGGAEAEVPDLSAADFSGADLSEPDLPDEPAAPGDDGDDAFGSGDREGDRRIGELLDEGQAAFDRGDHQGAIDIWSRIFLIDIDHAEASRRIEEARRLKSEQERQVEEVYHDAIRALEEGDREQAQEGLRKVLEMFPGHAAAREQLDRLEAGEAPAPPPPPTGAPEAPAAEPEEPEPLREEILVPPEPGEEVTAQPDDESARRPRTMVAKSSPASRRFLLLGSAVLALVLVLGFLLYQNRDSFFPNAAETPAEDAGRIDPIARATRLHEAGKTAMAVNQLRRLPPASPQYEEAQALISQWQAEERPPGQEQPGEGGGEAPPQPADTTQRELLDLAAAAADGGEYLRADGLLERAAALAPLPDDAQVLRNRVQAEVQPLQRYIDLLSMGEYPRALPELWRLHQEEPENRDVRRLIADAYYNLALRDLQQGDAASAVGHLEEAAGVLPDEAALERHLQFARTYAERDKDLLYRIYVKYMPPR